MRFLILLFPLIARANTIAEDAAGDSVSSMSADGAAWLVSVFFVFCACIAAKDRDLKNVLYMLAIAGAAWINTTVTAFILMALVVVIPIGIMFTRR